MNSQSDTPPPPPQGTPGSPLNSVFSDITMTDDDRRVSTASSLLEYSDTDEEGGPSKGYRTPEGQVPSTFRPRNDKRTQSERVVRFSRDENKKKGRKAHSKKQQQHSSKAFARQKNDDNNWMAQLAYSFRSPAPSGRKQHVRHDSNNLQEYPHFQDKQYDGEKIPIEDPDEASPLIVENSNRRKSRDLLSIAATFLRDYEANRPPTLSSNLSEITGFQILLHHFKYSGWFFHSLLTAATLSFFISCFMESFQQQRFHRILLTALNMFGVVVFSIDVSFRYTMKGSHTDAQHLHRVRSSRSERLIKPLILFMIVLAVENIARLLFTKDSIVLFSSLFKPLVLFYVSTQARDALESLSRISRIVLRVIAMELLLILMFAAVACRLFADYPNFSNLSTSWLSLFELATTVINPSLWMPMYQDSKASAFFFVFFIITSVFYLHSLVLSVVFQTYIHAAAEIHERSAADREDAIQLAFYALQEHDQRKNVISAKSVRSVLKLIRPHYNSMKINALVEIVDPSNQKTVDYPTFRTKIRQALNASIRTARSATTLAMSVELIAVAVAIVNFIYVILVSSAFNPAWFSAIQDMLGALITLVAGFELLVRFNPLRVPDFTPLTRLNTTFDGLALVASLVSFVGIVLFMAQQPTSLQYILMGRALDIFRVMRFFQIFRDVVRRSTDVLPALAGPIILIITCLHIFVYLGMALWGDGVVVGAHDGQITYLYDLNNFNSYQEGIVTMFQVLVVNDWHAIAAVFLYAKRLSDPHIVYPFFIAGNLIGVSILLNVATAFFVESFVTKLEDGPEGIPEHTTVQKDRQFEIQTNEKNSVRRVTTPTRFANLQPTQGIDYTADEDSDLSSESGAFEFDVYEREGFDRIMQTVAGASLSDNLAQQLCNYFEVFESLTPGRETVGYLICDQQTLERFGNRRFQNNASGFLEENQMHTVISDMHSELIALSNRPGFAEKQSLVRAFPHRQDPAMTLEVNASFLRRHPALSLFVSYVRTSAPR